MTAREPTTNVADRAEAEISRVAPPEFTPPPVDTGTPDVLQGIQFGESTPVAPENNPAFAADYEAIYTNLYVSQWGSSSASPFAERAMKPVADYIFNLTKDDPAIARLISEENELLAGLSDTEIQQRIRNGEGVFAGLYEDIADTAWEAGATELFVARAMENNQANEDLFNDLTIGFTTQSLGGGEAELSSTNGFDLEGTTGWALDAEGNLAVSFAGRRVQGADALTGVAAVSDPLTVIARIDPAAVINNKVDLLSELRKAAERGDLRLEDGNLAEQPAVEEATGLLAAMGRNVAGTPVEPALEGIADGIRMLGSPLALAGDVVDQAQGDYVPLFDRLKENRTIAGMAAAEAQVAMIQHPEAFVIASLATTLAAEIREQGGDITNTEAMNAVREQMTDDEIKQMADSFKEMTTAEFFNQIEAEAENITPGEAIFGAFGEAIDPGMKVLEAFDGVARTLAVSDWNFHWNAAQGAWEAIQTGDASQGLELFKEAITDPKVFDLSPAEWAASEGFVSEFNAEGEFVDATSTGQAINLFASFVYDPTNLLGIGTGGRSANRLAQAAFTDARYADVVPNLPTVRPLLQAVASDDIARATNAMLEMDGLGLRFHEMWDIARTPGRTFDEAADALKASLATTPGAGSFMGATPGFTAPRNTGLGLARQFDWMARHDAGGWNPVSQLLNTRHGRRWRDYVVKASTNRRISTIDFVDDAKRTIATLYHSDPDGMAQAFDGLADITRNYGHLSDARRGELVARHEEVTRRLAELKDQAKLSGATPSELQRALNEAQQALARGANPQLEEQVRNLSQSLNDSLAPFDELATERSALLQESGKIGRLLEQDGLSDLHEAYADWIYRVFDEQADAINAAAGTELIPFKLDSKGNKIPNLFSPDNYVRDWSNVTLEGQSLNLGDINEVDRLGSIFTEGTDAHTVARGIGMFNRVSEIPLPVSPSELIGIRAHAKNIEGWNAFRANAQIDLARKGIRAWRGLWSASVLMNPETAIRTGLDETLRLLVQTGDPVAFVKAQRASIPGFGKFGFDDMIDSPWVRSEIRGSGGEWQTIEQAGDWAQRSGKWTADGRAAVERFVNGTFISDDIFQNFARSLDDVTGTWIDDVAFPGGRRPIKAPDSFTEWWQTKGRLNVKEETINLGQGRKIENVSDPDEAFRAMAFAWNTWIGSEGVQASRRGAVARRLLDAATGKSGPLDEVADAGIINAIRKVPAQIPDESGFFWRTMFADPSKRRQGVIMQHYYDQYVQWFTDAHSARNGKYVVNADALVQRFGLDPGEAAWAVRQGGDNPMVRKLMVEQGVVSQREIERLAFNAAKRRADDLQYVLTATSEAGRKLDNPLIMPFARAQTDFIGWWWRYLSRPLQMRLGPESRLALENHPLLRAGVQAAEGAPAPVNFAYRTFRSLAHYHGAFSGSGEGEDRSVLARAADRLTFLPGPWSDDWLTKMTFAPGALPLWLIDTLLDDEGTAQSVVEQLAPALAWQQGQHFSEYVLPNSRRSVRNQLASGGRALSAMLGIPVDAPPSGEGNIPLLSQAVNFLEGSRSPYGTRDYNNAGWAEWMRTNGGNIPSPDSAEWQEAARNVKAESTAAAYKNQAAIDGTTYALPFYSVYDPNPYASDANSLVAFSAFFEDEVWIEDMLSLDQRLKDEGQVGIFEANLLYDDETGRPADDYENSRIFRAWQRWDDGEATPDDRKFLEDSMADVFFNRLPEVEVWEGYGVTYKDFYIATHPEAAIAAVTSLKPADIEPTTAEGRVFFDGEYDDDGNQISPPYVQGKGADARLVNIPPGRAGQEIRTRALTNGWVVERDDLDRFADATNIYRGARQEVIRMMWTLTTGRDWGSDSATETRDGRTVSGLPKVMQDRSFTLDDAVAAMASDIGLEVPGKSWTFQDWRQYLEDQATLSAPANYNFTETLTMEPGKQLLESDWGRGLVADLEEANKAYERAGVTRFSDWTDESKGYVREQMAEAIVRGDIKRPDYDRWWAPTFGDVSFTPPEPPPVSDLQMSIEVPASNVAVVDGDTLEVTMRDGTVPVRLIGLLAPDEHEPGFQEAADNLVKLLANADEVTFGIYDPDTFGTYQLQGPNRKRALMWLYVDGRPIWDPAIFSPDSPTGSQGTPRVSDLTAIYESNG